MGEFLERVAAGAAWLDANESGWVDRIDLETLNLDNCERCIGGQLVRQDADRTLTYGDWLVYWLGPVDDRTEWAVAHGFDVLGGDEYGYRDLTGVWRDLIAERRRVGAR